MRSLLQRPLRRLADALLLGMALALTACAAIDPPEPPKVRLVDVRFLDSSTFEQRMLVDLRITNPNNFDLPLEGLSFELEVNDKTLADGSSNKVVTIPRLGEARVPVVASVTLLGLVEQVMALGRSDHLSYRLKGRAYLDGYFGRGVPFDHGGKLELQTPAGGGHTLVPL